MRVVVGLKVAPVMDTQHMPFWIQCIASGLADQADAPMPGGLMCPKHSPAVHETICAVLPLAQAQGARDSAGRQTSAQHRAFKLILYLLY